MLSATLSSAVKRLINAFKIVSSKTNLSVNYITCLLYILYYSVIKAVSRSNKKYEVESNRKVFDSTHNKKLYTKTFSQLKWTFFDFWFDLNDVLKVVLKCLLTITTHQSTYWKRTHKLKIGFILSGLSATSFFVERLAKKIWTHIYLCPSSQFLLESYLDLRQVGKKVKRRC